MEKHLASISSFVVELGDVIKGISVSIAMMRMHTHGRRKKQVTFVITLALLEQGLGQTRPKAEAKAVESQNTKVNQSKRQNRKR